MDLVILNHSQVTRMTPELSPPSPNFHTTPPGERLILDIFNVHRSPFARRFFSGTILNSRHVGRDYRWHRRPQSSAK
ncbi:hypothetical protein TNCV_4644201 [Trichonephila clavipes]|nr:hypothetical protein TNCV_4644201 [Trichonephila clavipes]